MQARSQVDAGTPGPTLNKQKGEFLSGENIFGWINRYVKVSFCQLSSVHNILTASLQRPLDVPTASRSVHDASQCASSCCAHGTLTATPFCKNSDLF